MSIIINCPSLDRIYSFLYYVTHSAGIFICCWICNQVSSVEGVGQALKRCLSSLRNQAPQVIHSQNSVKLNMYNFRVSHTYIYTCVAFYQQVPQSPQPIYVTVQRPAQYTMHPVLQLVPQVCKIKHCRLWQSLLLTLACNAQSTSVEVAVLAYS